MPDETTSPLRQDLQLLLNRHSAESGSDTPDFVLAEYLAGCLAAFDLAVRTREAWYGRPAGNGAGMRVVINGA